LSKSGLLNILDGVVSQEGGIVLTTLNFADKLDDALVRPGRIDKQIFLGHISPRTAERMFMGMYVPEPSNEAQNTNLELGDNDMGELALRSSRQIPEDTFTPAQVQGYLLRCRDSPARAATEIATWIKEEKVRFLEAEISAEKE
jgi:chaperone BCS1